MHWTYNAIKKKTKASSVGGQDPLLVEEVVELFLNYAIKTLDTRLTYSYD